MVVVMDIEATEEQVQEVNQRLAEHGFASHLIRGVNRIVIGAVGDRSRMGELGLELLTGVEKVVPIMAPYKLASRDARGGPSLVPVGNAVFGGPEVVVIAGPCAVESEEQMLEAAQKVKEAGAAIMRGGAYKPRTSPYSFQGMEKDGLELLARVGQKTGLPTVSEVMDRESLAQAVEYVDMLQVGTRNMQNFKLLKAVGRTGKPVLLKRGLSATIEEWLMAAEYVMVEGNENVVLCERGIRTFESYTRNTLDLSAIPLVKRLSHLPVIVDPSHATGDRRLVPPMAAAAIAAGADGLLIEVHPDPPKALCDGAQSLNPGQFASLMGTLKAVAEAVGREI
ncbi:MAG TPA: 3-deoxy-7-phosphoheptulonate synthase [Spirochaetia bacterium]|nr:3-deoxy-7-phosphoheptulonate synthase [Spirochaetia bacterium]